MADAHSPESGKNIAENRPAHPAASTRQWLSLPPLFQGFAAWEWDIRERMLRFSPGWQRILMFPEDHPLFLSAETWWERVHQDDLEMLRQLVGTIVAGEMADFDVAYRIRRYDQGWTWVFSQGRVMEHKEASPVLVGGISVNVSRLRSDPKFQQSGSGVGDNLYHSMLENSPDLIVRLDRELFPLYINPAVSRYLDRKRNEFPGTNSIEELGIEPEQLAFLQRNINRVFDEKIAVKEMVSFTTGYGHPVTGEYSFWPEFAPDGSVVSVITQFRDLSEARLNELRLSALYQLTQMDTASEDDVLQFVLDSMRRLTNSSNSFIFIPENGLRGRGRMCWSNQVSPFLRSPNAHENDRLSKELLRILKRPDGSIGTRLIENGDGVQPVDTLFEGQEKVMRFIVAPGMEGDRVVCLAGVRNKPTDYNDSDLRQIETFVSGAWLILRRFRHMRELQQAKEAAEAANRAKAEFLADVNHELRTPLTSILGYAETLLSLAPEDEEARTRCLGVIQRHAEQMHRLVGELLSLSRMESSDMPLEQDRVPLAELAATMAETLQAQLGEKNLAVSLDIPGALMVIGDRHFLGQVFRNLLENACRYAAAGSGIGIRAEIREAEVLVSVHDEGPGIEPEDLERIFERFYRGRQRAETVKSTGLGLAICKHVVTRHGGRIWAENTPSGVTVHFTLPLPGAKA